MARISKQDMKKHLAACEMINSKDDLNVSQRDYIIENWNPMAEHNVGWNAAFFTPMGVARDLMIETLKKNNKRVLDLCAGVGRLAYTMWKQSLWGNESEKLELVCIEMNYEFARVGQRVLPEATWIRGDIFEESTFKNIGKFDEVISNPPYGVKVSKNGWLCKDLSQYMAAEVAMKLAPVATFILGQADCPFKMSGVPSFQMVHNERYEKWSKKTGIVFDHNCGLDLSHSNGEWVGLGNGMQFEIVNVSKPNAAVSDDGQMSIF